MKIKGVESQVYLLNRRQMLMLAGGASAISLFGCGGPPGGPFDNSPYAKQTIAGCVVSPEQTEALILWTKN